MDFAPARGGSGFPIRSRVSRSTAGGSTQIAAAAEVDPTAGGNPVRFEPRRGEAGLHGRARRQALIRPERQGSMARQDALHLAATWPRLLGLTRVARSARGGGPTTRIVEDCGERYVVRVGVPAHNISCG